MSKKRDYSLRYSLGINLIDILEQIHNAGFVYNDLKPENIMIGPYQADHPSPDNSFDNKMLHLIDFGFVSSFISMALLSLIIIQRFKFP